MMGRPRLSETSPTVRLHMKFPASLVDAVDAYRYENRIPSFSEAVRSLLEEALANRSADQTVGRPAIYAEFFGIDFEDRSGECA